MKGVTIVDAIIINAPSSTKNKEKAKEPEMHWTKNGNEWRFGMKCHIGADAGKGYVSYTADLRNNYNHIAILVKA